MKYILSIKTSYKPARILATKLGLKSTIDIRKLKEAPVIRYGNSSGVFDNDTLYNTPESIRLCGNSVKFGEWCNENDFRAPLYTPFDVNTKYEFPYLLRKSHHYGGKDILLVTDETTLDNKEKYAKLYHVPYIETDQEFGIHVVGNKVVRLFRKLPRDNSSDSFIRTQYKGYRYSIVSDLENNFKVAQRISVELFNKLGLGFGRIDMGYSSKRKTYYIFEVNTAPGLNNNSAEVYATHLRELLYD